MRAIPSHMWPQPVLPEATPTVRCCIVVTFQDANAITLSGDICVEHDELTLSEAAPGVWIAWLLLRCGTHFGTIEARRRPTDGTHSDRLPLAIRQRFALTIPPFHHHKAFAPELWLIRNRRGREEERL